MNNDNIMTQINYMKNLICMITMLLVALAIGNSAYAKNCNVRQGDSIWGICNRYHLDLNEVLKLNKHLKNPRLIYPNEKINLPHADTGTQTEEDSKSDNIQDGNETMDTPIVAQMKEVLDLVNQERDKQGLNPVMLNSELNHVATLKAMDMRDNNYFDHNSRTYGTPFEMLQNFGIHYNYAGENIAAGQKTSEQVMNDWMNSSGHRANILNKNYTHLGVGYVEGGSYGTYWVQEFTKPQ